MPPCSYIILPNGCWQWQGSLDQWGYGRRRLNGRRLKAHRAYYEELVGPIPAGLVIDHLCRNRACVNPAHMEPVTAAENTRRGWPATKTECINGHPYDETNTYYRPSGQRDCRACIRDRVARYKRRTAPLLEAA